MAKLTQQLNNSTTQQSEAEQPEVVVSVKNVSKKFCKTLKRSMAYGIIDLSKNLVGLKPDSNELRKDEFWALHDINLELRKGDVLGLIGVNGSGKTTLLRLLAGIFPPDKGEIMAKGRIGALIAVGAGFHPHMTGRENIYLNGTILGMSRDEIDSKFQEIVDFSAIGDFLDAPVSTYSSGMRVRLGFSIAVHIKPDILLIDEVLAVGDLNFTMKCFNAIDRIISNTAVIYVSHNISQVQRICNKILVMEKGKIVYRSKDVFKGVEYYYSILNPVEGIIMGSRRVTIHKIKLLKDSNEELPDELFKINYLDTLYVEFSFSINPEIPKCIFNIQFNTRAMSGAAQCLSQDCNFEILNRGNTNTIRVKFSKLMFSPGKYNLTIGATDEKRGEVLVIHYAAKEFQVLGAIAGNWPVQLDGKWEYV
jgi:lipopolysaccharide transport system ATP-binding protein